MNFERFSKRFTMKYFRKIKYYMYYKHNVSSLVLSGDKLMDYNINQIKVF